MTDEEQHYFLKNIPLVSANGFSIDVWHLQQLNDEMMNDSLFVKSTQWIREKMCNAKDWLLKSIREEDLRGVMNAIDSGVDVDSRDKKGRTALQLSVRNDSDIGLQITKFLLVRNASVNVKDYTRFKRTPLLEAVRANNFEAVRVLLKENIAIEEVDAIGRTALIYASEHDYDEIIELLVHFGADENACDLHGRSSKLLRRREKEWNILSPEDYDIEGREFWNLYGTWGGRDYEEEMF